ncbi:hypothetical protein [Flavobacterium sp.]|uniref:hypothetical protein n=1 Tax=Flavobacterium sp. TaxID=239 RepID=UPI0035B1F1B0
MKNYFIVSVLTLLIGNLLNFLLNLDELYVYSIHKKITSNLIDEYLSNYNKLKWFSYVIIPLFLLVKTTLIASIIYIGAFFYSKVKVTFKQLFNAIVKAEFVFLGVGILKIIWFYFFQTNYTLEDLQYFYPLSALNIVGYKGIDAWFIYPLQTLNLFELAYWFLLSFYVGKIASPTKNKEENKYPIDFGLKIVASSYGSALLLWIVVVMFFTLNYS